MSADDQLPGDLALPDDLAVLFEAEREIPVADSDLKARVLHGLGQSIGGLGGEGSGDGGLGGEGTGDPGGGGGAVTGVGDAGASLSPGAAVGSAATLSSGASLIQVAGISAVTFLAGAGSGVLLDRVVRAPVVIEVPVEVPVERIVEVRVPEPHQPEMAEPTQPDPSRRRNLDLKRVPTAPQPTEPTSALGREQRLIDTARAQIDRSPERALTTLARYRKQHPAGLLAEEAAAIEVLALRSAGRTEQATAAAERFFQKYPSSMFRGRIQDVLQ